MKTFQLFATIRKFLNFGEKPSRPTIDYVMNEAPLEERLYWLQKVSEVAHKEQQENMKKWKKMKKKSA